MWDEQQYDVSGLSDALIEQQSLGSLIVSALDFDLEQKYAKLNDKEFEKMRIKHNNDRDVYGITTVINFSNRKSHPYLEEIYNYLTNQAKKHVKKDEFKQFIDMLKTNKIGLFINERYMNLPDILTPKVLKSIPEDIEFTKKQDDIDDPSVYDFDYFLGIAKWSTDNLYYKPEEERFIDHASFSFNFSCKTKEGTERYKRIVYLLKYNTFKQLVENIDDVFTEEK